MGEWTRLTPENKRGMSAYYRHRGKGRLAPHRIRAGTREIGLSDTELLALAQASGVCRQLPEVQALVEVNDACGLNADEAIASTLNQLADRGGSNGLRILARELQERTERRRAALAPFQEADDG